MTSIDKITARILDSAGDTVSGLVLTEIGEDGHLLWKIAAYLRQRDR